LSHLIKRRDAAETLMEVFMVKPANAEKLYVVPCKVERACEYVSYLHRHHMPLTYGQYALACCTADGVVHGVVIVGRTVTQHFDEKNNGNYWVLEVRRCCTDGTMNAPSALYGAAWRFARAMGFRKMISYTLPSEGGASLRALGWKRVDNVGGNSWKHRTKRGYDIAPTDKKTRWEVSVEPEATPPFNTLDWPIFGNNPQLSMLDGVSVTGEGRAAGIQKEMFLQTGFFGEDGEIETFDVEYTEVEK
jgi:hypothetical protein